MADEPEETMSRDSIVCPYCVHKHRDPWETLHEDEATTDIECESCGRLFRATLRMYARFTGKPIEESNHG